VYDQKRRRRRNAGDTYRGPRVHRNGRDKNGWGGGRRAYIIGHALARLRFAVSCGRNRYGFNARESADEGYKKRVTADRARLRHFSE